MIAKVDWNEVRQLEQGGFILVNKHPEHNLWVLKYTPECEFKKHWTPLTKTCRGLVIDEYGIIWSRPFPKFFNNRGMETDEGGNQLDWSKPFIVTEKIDGSCIQMFRYGDELITATLGSFTSEQSLEAKKITSELQINTSAIMKGATFVFEVIYPENRIVVNYGDSRRLVLLGVVDALTGAEVAYNDLHIQGNHLGCEVVKSIDIADPISLIELQKRSEYLNEEGYVVRFDDNGTCFRVKVKFEQYFVMHKLWTGMSDRYVLEYLRDNSTKLTEHLEEIPDEFFEEIKKIEDKLLNSFADHKHAAESLFKKLWFQSTTKKDFALLVMEDDHSRSYNTVLFAMWDDKQDVATKCLWNMVEKER